MGCDYASSQATSIPVHILYTGNDNEVLSALDFYPFKTKVHDDFSAWNPATRTFTAPRRDIYLFQGHIDRNSVNVRDILILSEQDDIDISAGTNPYRYFQAIVRMKKYETAKIQIGAGVTLTDDPIYHYLKIASVI